MDTLLAGLSREQLDEFIAVLRHWRRLKALCKLNPGNAAAAEQLAAFDYAMARAAEDGRLPSVPAVH